MRSLTKYILEDRITLGSSIPIKCLVSGWYQYVKSQNLPIIQSFLAIIPRCSLVKFPKFTQKCVHFSIENFTSPDLHPLSTSFISSGANHRLGSGWAFKGQVDIRSRCIFLSWPGGFHRGTRYPEIIGCSEGFSIPNRSNLGVSPVFWDDFCQNSDGKRWQMIRMPSTSE